MPLCPLKRRMVIRSANPPNTQRCFKKASIDHFVSHTIQVSMPYFRSDSTLEPKFQSLSSAFVVRTVERQTPMQLATVDLALAIRVKTPTRDPPSFVTMQKRSISSTIFNRIAAVAVARRMNSVIWPNLPGLYLSLLGNSENRCNRKPIAPATGRQVDQT